MSDQKPLENPDLNLQRLSSEAISRTTSSAQGSPPIVSINPRRSLRNSNGGNTSAPDLDTSNSNNSPTSSSGSKKKSKPIKGKPSSALMQAKLNAQMKRANLDDPPVVIIKDHLQPARDSKDITRKGTAVIYDMRMVNHRSPWDPTHPERPERFSSIIDRCKELKLLERCIHIEPRPALEQEILTLHTKEHIVKLMELSRDYKDNMDTLEEHASTYDAIYFHPSTYELALLACGSTIDLVNSVLAGKVQNGMAIIRPPGHHAMKAEYCGYCYFNNVALAAHSALANGSAKKILIVDFDVHHGQATQQMFYNDPRVLYFSTHRYQHGTFWPNLEESNYHWIGDKAGLGYNCNIPLNEIGMGNTEFLTIWHQILMPLAYQFNPDLVIVSAGYDAALGCPEGEMRVTPQCYPHLISPLMGLANGKVAVILEGGYCLKSLSEGAALTLKTLLGDPCPTIPPISSPTPILTDTILNSIYMLRKHWELGTQPFLEGAEVGGAEIAEDEQEGNLHSPSVKYEWTEPKPARYPTRNCYPIVDPAVVAELETALDKLILTTSLAKATHSVGLVYDDIMLKHRNMLDPGHPERPERVSNIFACHADFGLVERCLRIDSRKATDEELRLIHTEEHILRMRNTQRLGNKDLSNLQSKYNSIFLNNSSYESALVSAGSVLQVVDKVINGECQSGIAIVRPPGHHAESEEPCGFCIFNNVSLAAKYALTTHDVKKVLIVDFDVHHGNGIQRMFESDPRVLYISLHRYDWGAFFPGSPEADYTHVGKGKGEGFNVNIPWNRGGMGDTEYMFAFNSVVLPIAYEFSPELVLVSAGFDAARGDPLGGCRVTPEGYAQMTHRLAALANGKIILALEGGYNLTSIAYSMTLCTKALLGDPIPPLTLNSSVDDSARKSVSNVLSLHSKYWTVLKPFQKNLPTSDTIIEPGKYTTTQLSQEEMELNKQLENLHLGPSTPRTVEDNINANSFVQIIPDPPPASGEPSLSLPSPPGNNSPRGTPQGSRTSVGGGEVGAGPVPHPQGNEDEALLGAVGGTANDNVRTIQDVYRVMVNENATEGDARMYLVSPLPWCPHMETVNPVPNERLNCRDPCQDCLSTEENWVCLSCYSVFCSRYVREHMVMHSIESGHKVALSYADLSVWCYECNSYIDCQVLTSAKQAAYRSKFGVDLPGGPSNSNHRSSSAS